VLEAVAQVSRSGSPEGIDPQQGLFDIGLDSLMSVELKGLLEKGARRALPATLTFNYPTPFDLAGYLNEVLFPEQAPEPAREPGGLPAGEAEDLDDLSEAELERMLEERLRKVS
jgi:acyl carrier protein